MDGLWEPPIDPGYAVELWVLPERISHAALASLIEPGPPNDDYKHLFLLELTASDRQSLLPPGLVRFLHRWPPGDSGGDNLFSSRYYIPYRWHHLVAQSNDGWMELYMDGVPRSRSRPVVATKACRLLVGTQAGAQAQAKCTAAPLSAGSTSLLSTIVPSPPEKFDVIMSWGPPTGGRRSPEIVSSERLHFERLDPRFLDGCFTFRCTSTSRAGAGRRNAMRRHGCTPPTSHLRPIRCWPAGSWALIRRCSPVGSRALKAGRFSLSLARSRGPVGKGGRF